MPNITKSDWLFFTGIIIFIEIGLYFSDIISSIFGLQLILAICALILFTISFIFRIFRTFKHLAFRNKSSYVLLTVQGIFFLPVVILSVTMLNWHLHEYTPESEDEKLRRIAQEKILKKRQEKNTKEQNEKRFLTLFNNSVDEIEDIQGYCMGWLDLHHCYLNFKSSHIINLKAKADHKKINCAELNGLTILDIEYHSEHICYSNGKPGDCTSSTFIIDNKNKRYHHLKIYCL